MADASRAEVAEVERVLDRIEDRVMDAAMGLFVSPGPADPAALEAAELPPRAHLLWARYDGFDLANGEARLYGLEEMATETTRAVEADLVLPTDRVIAERGEEVFVLPADPWAEGGEVVVVEPDGQRAPYASTPERFLLTLFGDVSVLYDREGEFQVDLIGEDGDLTPAVKRRLLRRRLDLDPDAPLARFELAQLLRRDGELRAAKRELEQARKRAPDFVWIDLELGRVCHGLSQERPAVSALMRVAEGADDPALAALAHAWMALASSDPATQARARAAAIENAPDFVTGQEAGARAALERGDARLARELFSLGLGVAPGHLGLLSLRGPIEALEADEA